jgi:hypothetical protein
MEDKENISHTNDVPITSITTRSPTLWGLLTRNLSLKDCEIINELFLFAVSLGANNELIHREKGVTFNPRLARIIQIAAEKEKISLELVSACLLSACEYSIDFENKLCSFGIYTKNLKLQNIADNAKLLDRLRHIHLEQKSVDEITKFLEQSNSDLTNLEDSILKQKIISIIKNIHKKIK